jgi:type IV secretion system protein TrbI
MATGTKKLAPAASRSWLKYGLVAMTLVIGSVLVYRNLVGTTIKEQKALSAKEKEARDLGNKTPGNAEAFSTRLASRRQESEEQAAKDRANAPTPPDSGMGSRVVDAAKAAPTAGMPKGKPQADSPSDSEIDAYANRKEENLQAQSKKLTYWEAPVKNSLTDAGGLEQMLGQLGNDQGSKVNNASKLAQQATPQMPAGSQALIDNFLKGQTPSQAAPTAAKDVAFVKGLEAKEIARPLVVQAGPGRFSLLEGTAIPVVMKTAISSDLPGPCRAAVEQDVYDSINQSIRIIPAGSTVICAYNSELNVGQDRLMLAFTRLIFPNGTSVALGGMEGGDEQGKIGAKADVNTRFWSRFGSSLMIAGISTLTQGILPLGSGITVNMPGSSSSGAGTQALGEVAKKSFERNLNIKEELRLSPGDRLRVIVTRDMVLDPSLTQVQR